MDPESELTPTPFELQQQRNALTIAQNERRESLRLRAVNQKAGFSEPQPGDVLYVQLDSTVRSRTRAGLRFERGKRRKVTVTDLQGSELEAAQRRSEDVVSAYGAERILEDSALHVYQAPMTSEDVAELTAKNLSLEEELKTTRAECESLKKRVRDARMAAPSSDDGRPTRLQAAQKARSETGATEAESEFGAAPTTVRTTARADK